MPTATYIPIATQTLGSNTATVTFSSIPQTYRDLVIVARYEGDNAGSGEFIPLLVNGETTPSGTTVSMSGTGSNTPSGTNGSSYSIFTATAQCQTVIQIFDYSITDKQKTMLTRTGAHTYRVVAAATRLNTTSAITQIKLNDTNYSSSLFKSGGVFTLYGIAG